MQLHMSDAESDVDTESALSITASFSCSKAVSVCGANSTIFSHGVGASAFAGNFAGVKLYDLIPQSALNIPHEYILDFALAVTSGCAVVA